MFGTLVFINCNLELLINTFKWGNCSKMFFLMEKQKDEKKQTNAILIRSHQNDTSNLSPALIQPHVQRRPLTGLQFDVQRKTKLILGKRYFRTSDSSVVTFTPRNYTSKPNLRKRCCLCYDNKIGPGQNTENHEISVKQHNS